VLSEAQTTPVTRAPRANEPKLVAGRDGGTLQLFIVGESGPMASRAGRVKAAKATSPLSAHGILLSIRVDFGKGHRIGPGKIVLLERIMDTGSISAAGRQLKMSYRRAWLLVDAMNRTFAKPVIISAKGGARGGGAEVTTFGRNLVKTYRAMERRFVREANRKFSDFRKRY